MPSIRAAFQDMHLIVPIFVSPVRQLPRSITPLIKATPYMSIGGLFFAFVAFVSPVFRLPLSLPNRHTLRPTGFVSSIPVIPPSTVGLKRPPQSILLKLLLHLQAPVYRRSRTALRSPHWPWVYITKHSLLIAPIPQLVFIRLIPIFNFASPVSPFRRPLRANHALA
ncbi:hypothetical protein PV10_00866 [Exophiala mesophila]|uniref:Uncharacterized protein n=1 Tax=Exophiala mesophila TaxID=212818 RepID=A0A0D1X5N4_EXOME|nr:uncharacterized protein PV10_00866 [Exophiala mesophila]KIV97070.1 hypothetical protein PV10_00866 [Exophiala mesophila]